MKRSRRPSDYQHNALDPGSLVVILKSHLGCVRLVQVPVEEEEMVKEHDQQPTGDQHHIKILLMERHMLLLLLPPPPPLLLPLQQ